MRIPQRYRLNKRGDTIVEVLIAILVIGTVLAGAYSTANNSLSNVREAQEHEEATLLAQAQLEVLSSSSLPASITAPASPSFCFYTSETTPLNALYSEGDPIIEANPDAAGSAYDTSCMNQGTDTLYTINIRQVIQVTPSKPIPTFQIDITWLRLGGGTNDVQMFFQPYPGVG